MAMKTKLLITDKNAVREALQKTENEIKDHISSVKQWFQSQKHLPEIPCK